jgi:hypothetical protein
LAKFRHSKEGCCKALDKYLKAPVCFDAEKPMDKSILFFQFCDVAKVVIINEPI